MSKEEEDKNSIFKKVTTMMNQVFNDWTVEIKGCFNNEKMMGSLVWNPWYVSWFFFYFLIFQEVKGEMEVLKQSKTNR